MTQREHVIRHLLGMSKNAPHLVQDIQRDLSEINPKSLSSILTILGKTEFFKRTVVVGDPAFVKIKVASFQEVMNTFRKKATELYSQFKGESQRNSRNRVKKVVEPHLQKVVPSLEPSSGAPPEILDVYLGNIVKSLRHHVDEIECIFKEFKELRTLQGLVEKFVKGDKK